MSGIHGRLSQPDALINTQIAGYELTRLIAVGGMSEVFRARRLGDSGDSTALADRPAVAAIKVLAPAPDARDDEVADVERRFAREAETLRRLTHPAILPIIGAGRDLDTGYFYIILPYMSGGSLSRALARQGQPPLETVADILARVAGALDFAHAQGIVHRDVKPGNVLLDAQGAAHLGDFGLARAIAPDLTAQTTLGRVLGSPAYMAPEQFCDTERVGPMADLYGLSMVAYQLVTGQVAFDTSSIPALMYKSLNERPASPRRTRPDLPEPAAAAILHGLEKDPARRFATAGSFAEAFSLGLQGEWTEELQRYSPLATRTAWRGFAGARAAAGRMTAHVIGRDASNDSPTWTDTLTPRSLPSAPVEDATYQAWGSRLGALRDPRRWLEAPHLSGVRAGVAVALLLCACLFGSLYLGATLDGGDASQAQQSEVNSSVGASLGLNAGAIRIAPVVAKPATRSTAPVTHPATPHSPGGGGSHHHKHHHDD